MTESWPPFDPPLSPDQLATVDTLTPMILAQIDSALLAMASDRWRKMARIVGTAMANVPDCPPGVPDIYFAQRLARLVEIGLLEAEGDARCMTHCEVRLSGAPARLNALYHRG